MTEKNTLWKPGSTESFVLSGDALNTGNQENHTLVCVRSANLIDGFSSALNFFPIINDCHGDKWPNLRVAFQAHLSACLKIVMEGKLLSCTNHPEDDLCCLLFATGDLVYINSSIGMNPPGSQHGSPWLWRKADGTVVWRGDWDHYLYSHEKPPLHDWERDGPIHCPCEDCDFSAKCDNDIEEDKV